MSPIKWVECASCKDEFPSFAVKPLYLPKWVGNVELGVHYFCQSCRPEILEELKMQNFYTDSLTPTHAVSGGL